MCRAASCSAMTSALKDCAVNGPRAAKGTVWACSERSTTCVPAMWLTGSARYQRPGPPRIPSVARAEAVSA